MPTSSQSRILSVVDHQIQQQSTTHEGASVQLTIRRSSRDDRRGSARRDDEDDKISPSARQRSFVKSNESQQDLIRFIIEFSHS